MTDPAMTEPTPEAERLLTPEMVAGWLRERGLEISASSVRRHIRAGELPGHIVGNRFVTPLPMLHRWIYGSEQKTAETGEGGGTAPRPMVIPFVGRRAS